MIQFFAGVACLIAVMWQAYEFTQGRRSRWLNAIAAAVFFAAAVAWFIGAAGSGVRS